MKVNSNGYRVQRGESIGTRCYYGDSYENDPPPFSWRRLLIFLVPLTLVFVLLGAFVMWHSR